MIGVVQQAIVALKREIEGSVPATPAAAARTGSAAPDRRPARGAFAPALDAYKYVGFEDQFRGSREVIRARLESYVPFFDGASDVLDVGCGRGEFLDLLPHRHSARGIDLNHEMAEDCRARGLDVPSRCGRLPHVAAGRVLGGIFAAQVVEHLSRPTCSPSSSSRSTSSARAARMVLETLNPACWIAFFESYIRDITHVWPLHPETLNTSSWPAASARGDRIPLAGAGGDRLQPVEAAAAPGPASRPGRLLQRQRRQTQRPDVHVHGLRDRRREGDRRVSAAGSTPKSTKPVNALLRRAGWAVTCAALAVFLQSFFRQPVSPLS